MEDTESLRRATLQLARATLRLAALVGEIDKRMDPEGKKIGIVYVGENFDRFLADAYISIDKAIKELEGEDV